MKAVLTITAQRFRTQERNRVDGLSRLTTLIRKAATPPKPRRKTRPPKKSIEKRIQNKKYHSRIKKLRQTNVCSDD
jgi:ribosome-associated protein